MKEINAVSKIEGLVKEREENFSWINEFEDIDINYELRNIAVKSFTYGVSFAHENIYLKQEFNKIKVKQKKGYNKIKKGIDVWIAKEKVPHEIAYLSSLVANSNLKPQISEEKDLWKLKNLSGANFIDGYIFGVNTTQIVKKRENIYGCISNFDSDLLGNLLTKYLNEGKFE